MTDDERLEAKARRAAKRIGLQATKSRARLSLNNRGAFCLRDPDAKWIIAGEKFDMTAQDVIEFCEARAD